MKLTNLSTSTAVKPNSGFGQNEKAEQRLARMKAFWSDKANSVLHPVGFLLAIKVGGKRLADLLVAGEKLEMSEISVNGKALPLQPGFVLSLENVAQVWGCPACRSAHGSGVYPSKEEDSDGLARNRFFYRPSDKALFVISDTCWKAYCKDLGAVTAARFAPVKAVSTAQA